MFENIMKFFKKSNKKEALSASSKDTAKERLHLVLMQDRANVSADFLDLMRQEIIEVIKKYIDIDESAMDVRLTNQANEDGTQGAPALYANIPIVNIKEETRKMKIEQKNIKQEIETKEDKKDEEEAKEETKKIEEEAKKIVEEQKTEEKKSKKKQKEETTEDTSNVVQNKKNKESEDE